MGILSGCFLFGESVTAALFQMGSGLLAGGLGLLLGLAMLQLTRLYIRFTRCMPAPSPVCFIKGRPCNGRPHAKLTSSGKD